MNAVDATYRAAPPPARVPARVLPRTGPSRPTDRSAVLRVILATVFMYLLLLPEQFNPTIGGVYLSPFRAFLLVASLYLLAGGLRGAIRFVWPDLFIALGMAWIWLASYMTSGSIVTAVVVGGSHTVDIGLSYFVARATIQTPTDLRRVLVLIAPGIAFVGAIIVTESVTHTLILQRIAGSLTGLPYPTRLDVRMGLMRGFGPFPHPILAGICLGSLLPIYLLSGVRGWPRLIGVAGTIGGLLTMSSAAMLAIVVGGVLSIYDWLSERIANLNWRLFVLFSGMLYVVVELTTKSGFYNLLIRYASLNSVSAYNRVLIWNFGTENVSRNPWFGIGYADWERPDWMHSDSFDHFWLLLALRFGIPATIFLLGASLMGVTMVGLKAQRMDFYDARLARGIAISLAVFVLGVNSVALWMAALAWFFMLLGVAVSLGSGPVARPMPPSVGPAAGSPKVILSR